MKILVCPDSLKESLSAHSAAVIIKDSIAEVFPDADVLAMPLADGGEGTAQVLVQATSGRLIEVEVYNPVMTRIKSFYGILGDGRTAVIEMAAASGLELLKDAERNPALTTTLGTGELIRHALSQGCSRIIIGLGGSATNDGGAGMASGVGYRLLDEAGRALVPGGGSLGALERIVASDFMRDHREVEFIAACDVTNPLCGPSGASFVYGPQKGATQEQVWQLDSNLEHLAAVIKRDLGADVKDLPGAGAAGGLGAGVMAFLGAELRAGFEIVSSLLDLERKIQEADLIITAEGRVDLQTLRGKVPAGVAALAGKYNKPVLVMTGTVGEGAEKLYEKGVTAIVPLTDAPMTLEDAKRNAPRLLHNAVHRTMKILSIKV